MTLIYSARLVGDVRLQLTLALKIRTYINAELKILARRALHVTIGLAHSMNDT